MTQQKKTIVVLSVVGALVVGYIIYLQLRLQSIYNRTSSQADALAAIKNPSTIIDQYSGGADVEKVINEANQGLYQAKDIEELLSLLSDQDLRDYLDLYGND